MAQQQGFFGGQALGAAVAPPSLPMPSGAFGAATPGASFVFPSGAMSAVVAPTSPRRRAIPKGDQPGLLRTNAPNVVGGMRWTEQKANAARVALEYIKVSNGKTSSRRHLSSAPGIWSGKTMTVRKGQEKPSGKGPDVVFLDELSVYVPGSQQTRQIPVRVSGHWADVASFLYTYNFADSADTAERLMRNFSYGVHTLSAPKPGSNVPDWAAYLQPGPMANYMATHPFETQNDFDILNALQSNYAGELRALDDAKQAGKLKMNNLDLFLFMQCSHHLGKAEITGRSGERLTNVRSAAASRAATLNELFNELATMPNPDPNKVVDISKYKTEGKAVQMKRPTGTRGKKHGVPFAVNGRVFNGTAGNPFILFTNNTDSIRPALEQLGVTEPNIVGLAVNSVRASIEAKQLAGKPKTTRGTTFEICAMPGTNPLGSVTPAAGTLVYGAPAAEAGPAPVLEAPPLVQTAQAGQGFGGQFLGQGAQGFVQPPPAFPGAVTGTPFGGGFQQLNIQ